MKMLKHNKKCKIQLMFKDDLQKYIQIKDNDKIKIDSKNEIE